MKNLVLLIIFGIIFSLNISNADNNYACADIYSPVIGTDGKTYGNECEAKKAGVFKDKYLLDKVNPASKFCISKGGKSEIKKDNKGNEYAVCVFENGTKVDEWDFFRRLGETNISNEKILNSYLDFKISFPMPISDEKEFLEKHGKLCISASDSINTHFIKDGEIVGSTKIGVPKNFKASYTCIAFEGLVLDENLEKNFENSLKKLSLDDIKKINSALKNFYKDLKDFDGNLVKTQALVKKIDKIKETSKFRTEKPILVLDYIKYQVIELFSPK